MEGLLDPLATRRRSQHAGQRTGGLATEEPEYMGEHGVSLAAKIDLGALQQPASQADSTVGARRDQLTSCPGRADVARPEVCFCVTQLIGAHSASCQPARHQW